MSHVCHGIYTCLVSWSWYIHTQQGGQITNNVHIWPQHPLVGQSVPRQMTTCTSLVIMQNSHRQTRDRRDRFTETWTVPSCCYPLWSSTLLAQKTETMYKLLSSILNYDALISTCIWLAQFLLSYIFIKIIYIFSKNISHRYVYLKFVFTALCQSSCACYHVIV